jgi:hypothetical protein
LSSAEVKLARLVGELADERVLIAVLPEAPRGIGYQRVRLDVHEVVAVMYDHGPEYQRRLLDLDGPRARTRWWKVVAYARSEGLDTIPVRYDGPAADIPERFLTEHPGEVVLLRLASSGPWHVLERRPLPPPEARGRGL